MARKKSSKYSTRKYIDKSDVFIDCQPHTCKYHSANYFPEMNSRVQKTCTGANRSLNGWIFVNAPSWCPRRDGNKFVKPLNL